MPTPTKILVLVLIVAFSQGQPLDIGDNDYGNLTCLFTQFSKEKFVIFCVHFSYT